MLKRRNRFSVSIMFCLIFLLWSLSNVAIALTVERLTFEELVNGAETIAIGVVEQAEAAYGEGKRSRRIFTTYYFSLSEVLKGQIEIDQPFQISIIGGRVGDKSHFYPGTPQLRIGAKYLIFVNGNNKYPIPLVGATQGIFSITQKASGEEYVVPMQGAHLIARDTPNAVGTETKVFTDGDEEVNLKEFMKRINAVFR